MATLNRMSTEAYDQALHTLLAEFTSVSLLSIPGVYECVTREYHNQILEVMAEQHPQDSDPDAPQVGDLVFDPNNQSIALQSPFGTITQVNGKIGMQTYSVDIDNDEYGTTVGVEFYNSAWFLTDDYLEAEDTAHDGTKEG